MTWRCAAVSWCSLVLLFGGCDDRRKQSADDLVTTPPPSRAATGPSLSEQLAAVAPFKMPATTRSFDADAESRPAAATTADPLATPESAVLYLLDNARKGRWREARQASLEQLTGDQLQQRMRVFASLQDVRIEPVQTRLDRGIGITIVCCENVRTQQKMFAPFMVAKRFDRWKVQVDNVNPRYLSPLEKESLPALIQWAHETVKNLSPAPATLPAAAAAPTPPAAPAAPPTIR